MVESEGKWHNLLNDLRKSFRHYMDGEISMQQRQLGLEYGINYGVSLMHLKDIASGLPRDCSLADLMWQKDVREMKILSIFIYPTEELSHEKAITLCKECSTREMAEQLVIRQLRFVDAPSQLLLRIFELNLPEEHPASVVPYLLLVQLAHSDEISIELINKLLPQIGQDLQKNDLSFLTALNNALTRLAEVPKLRPALMHIATTALLSLPSETRGHTIAGNLKEYLLEL